MPSKKPIFPLRLEPALRARADAYLAQWGHGATLTGWLVELLQWDLDRMDAKGKTAAAPAVDPLKRAAVSQNAPCPCGSGKKFKRCCGSKV